jgi:hypothetical protein
VGDGGNASDIANSRGEEREETAEGSSREGSRDKGDGTGGWACVEPSVGGQSEVCGAKEDKGAVEKRQRREGSG